MPCSAAGREDNGAGCSSALLLICKPHGTANVADGCLDVENHSFVGFHEEFAC